MLMTPTIKLTRTQKKIIKWMILGLPMMIGTSETTGAMYYMIASTHDNGHGNTYFNSLVFGNMLHGELICQDSESYDWVLTPLAVNLYCPLTDRQKLILNEICQGKTVDMTIKEAKQFEKKDILTIEDTSYSLTELAVGLNKLVNKKSRW